MNSERYLSEVLGFRILPSALPRTSVSVPSTYGVYLEGASAPEHLELLTKMLKAIGQENYPRVPTLEEASAFHHVLEFAARPHPFETRFEGGVRFWNFGAVENYTQGPPDSIGDYKRKAWEFLKQFRGEVL